MDTRRPLSCNCRVRLLSAAVIVGAVVPCSECVWGAQDLGRPESLIAGQVDLLRLVDLSAQRLGLSVEYDANALKSVSVTLRLDGSLGDEELWGLTNQMLAARGFTSLRAAGTGGDATRDVLSIVKLSEAAGLARVERQWPKATRAGFVTAYVPVLHRPLKDVSAAVKILISKPGGAVEDLAGENALLISDLRPRLDQIIEIVRVMDAPELASELQTIESRHLSATMLAALATAAATSGNVLAARPLQGKVTATPDERAVIIIAPQNEMPQWQELIAQFDRPPHVETRTYAMSAFSLEEVAKLIEQTAREIGPRGAGESWRIVQDSLAGLLIITATSIEHEQIAMLVERLNAVPVESRRPVRAFPIRNRSVGEIVEVLTKMLEAGVLEGAPPGGAIADDATGPSRIAPDLLQRSGRTSESPATSPPVDPVLSAGPTTAPAQAPRASPSVNGSRQGQATDRTTPPLTITADDGTNTLIAVGDPRKLNQLEELLRTLDVRQPQVMIEVLVVSLNEGDTLDLGVELEKIEISGDTIITLSSLFGLTPASGAAAGKGFSGLILNPGDFRVLIRALQTLNEGRTLNMPKVLVNNNQQASLDAVVQQPFVSTNASNTVATTSFGGFENAGTTITVKPQIAKGDHLVLEYSVSLSAFVGESSDPGIPPPRQQNNLQSVVTIPDGYTVVVGGIEVETNADAVSQVPLLADVPFIGEAFKSRSRSNSTSRFYIFIRPTVLRQEGFEDLKYLSDVDTATVQVDDGFPEVRPRVIR